MAMTCTICREDPELLEQIDADLLAGVPLRDIARRRLGNLRRFRALSRHKHACMAVRLMEAGETRTLETKVRLEELRVQMEGVLAKAGELGDLRAAVAAGRALQSQEEFLHKVDAELDGRAREHADLRAEVEKLTALVRGFGQELLASGGRGAVERGLQRARLERARLADVLDVTDAAALTAGDDRA